jgi:hypothetical protein
MFAIPILRRQEDDEFEVSLATQGQPISKNKYNIL